MGTTPEEQTAARELLGYYHLSGGQPPGGFTTALFNTFEHADNVNFRKLDNAFPAAGNAAYVMKMLGTDALRELANGA